MLLGVLWAEALTAVHEEYWNMFIPKLMVKIYGEIKTKKINNTVGFKRNQGISEREGEEGAELE